MTTTPPELAPLPTESRPTAEQVAGAIGANTGDKVNRALASAIAEVDQALERRWRTPSGAEYRDMIIEVANEEYRRLDSPSGSSQYAEFTTGQPVRAPRDPLTQTWPKLRRYVAPF